MRKTIDDKLRASTVLRLEELRLSSEETSAVKRGLTIALTRKHLERRGAHARVR